MSEYREVLQNPKLAFRDSELQTAEVKKSPLGLPHLVSGGFALTACLTTKSNGNKSKLAIRCFHKEVPDLQDRYKYISDFFQKHKENFLVNFTYDPHGINVQGKCYPIVKMDWVEGESLLEYIGTNISNSEKIRVLADQLRRIGARLNQLNIAHGDLQHGNILVRSDGSPVLIDYDGTYVRGMPFKNSNELGHPSYQHPGRNNSFFNEKIDNFSLAVIYVSLHILASSEGSQIWRKYRDSEKIIFSREDYRNPANSPIFQEILKNTQVNPLIGRLKNLCTLPVDSLPTLEEFLNPTFSLPTVSERTSLNTFVSDTSKSSGQYEIIEATNLDSLIQQDGNQIAVVGKVSRIHKYSDITFINFGERRTTQINGGNYYPFCIVVFFKSLQAWNKCKNIEIEELKSEYVKITGLLELYEKQSDSSITPQIILSDPFQIKIIKEDEYLALTQPSLPNRPRPEPTQAISSFQISSSQNSLPPKPVPPRSTPPQVQSVAPANPTLGSAAIPIPGTNLTLELVQIPAGSFQMGSNQFGSEKPIHTATLKAFWMGKYAVTQELYQAVMGINPSNFKGANLPVEQVSWDDAKEFCRKLSQRIGKQVRLPSEAEWEYACRSGSTGDYYFGNDENQLGNYAWYSSNAGGKTHPIGQKKPNAWGLYDMHGNVWEWCEDVWHDNYNGAPTDGTAWTQGGDQSRRLLRGGSWYDSAYNCRSANRFRYTSDPRHYYYGFRVVVSLL